ncbi:hypothetical protein PV326_005399 [Microctonus aethiopoides]|nr:hypothetical protein PV326_005399 [Microctonus aethiopoides]
MSEKGIKWPSSWSPPDENTENIASVELPQEIQRELDCTVGEYVFLEYPWAFICRHKVMQQACRINSPLNIYKDKIEIYKSEYFLIAYASSELLGNKFIICLTDEIRDIMVKRNREVTKNILEKVRRMMVKTGNINRALSLKNEENFSRDISVNSSRPPFEVELFVKISALKRNRKLSDRNSDSTRDSYIDLIPTELQIFNNIPMKKVAKFTQTTLESRDASVQSYLGYLKHKWTQCNDTIDVQFCEVIDDESVKEDVNKLERQMTREESSSTHLSETITEDKQTIKEIVSKSEIKLQEQLELLFFLQSRYSEIIDYVSYNSEINIHSDDIDNLMKNNSSNFYNINNADYYSFKSSCSFIDLNITKGRVISDVSWHQDLVGLVAISYVNNPRHQVSALDKVIHMPNNCLDCDTDINVLIWSLSESLKPKLRLNDLREIEILSFCPVRADILIGGCTNGQLVLWDLREWINKIENSTLDDEIPVIKSIVASDSEQSHSSAICGLHWLPSHYRIECDGTLSQLPENISMQFMTCSQDGEIAIWDLLWQPDLSQAAKNLKTIVTVTMSLTDDIKRLDGIFRPHYRLYIQFPKESINMSLLDFCISEFNNSDVDDDKRKFWASTVQGEIILCTWHGQEYEITGEENCDVIDRTGCVHDGPIIKIIRSLHINNVLLSIGGSVFAIWHENYLKHPVMWRKRDCHYSTCCWSHRPGVFIAARCDGCLETWDLYRKTKQPVHVQTISGKLITGLYMYNLSYVHSNIIGICDENGIFRFVNEVVENELNHREKIDWFSKFIDREVERKNEFYGWQNEYLTYDKRVLERKALRVAEEAKRRHEEAREKFLREQEEQARIKAEKKIRNIVPSKATLLRMKNIKKMKCTLLEKKGFDPEALEKIRYPLVQQQVEKTIRMNKAREKVADREIYFAHDLAVKFPECIKDSSAHASNKTTTPTHLAKNIDDVVEEYRNSYIRISNEAKKSLQENPRIPKFNWNSVMKEGRRRRNCTKEY